MSHNNDRLRNRPAPSWYPYKDNLTSPRTIRIIEEIQNKERQYVDSGFADNEFCVEFYSGKNEKFFQRLWEMNLYHYLLSNGYQPEHFKGAGPDFLFHHKGKRIWIEAVSPEPKGFKGDYLAPIMNGDIRIGDLPFNEIVLRLRSAVAVKNNKYISYLKSGVVLEDDICVVALDCGQLGEMGNEGFGFPSIVHALYPVGYKTCVVDRHTGSIVDSHVSYRGYVNKKDCIKVDTDPFCNIDYSVISAAICAKSAVFGLHLSPTVVHNYYAVNAMPQKLFCDVKSEYYVTIHENGFNVNKIK